MLATPSDPAATTRCHCRGGSGVSTRRFRGIAHQLSPAWRRAATLRSGGLALAQGCSVRGSVAVPSVWCRRPGQARPQCARGAFEPSHVNRIHCFKMSTQGQDTRAIATSSAQIARDTTSSGAAHRQKHNTSPTRARPADRESIPLDPTHRHSQRHTATPSSLPSTRYTREPPST